MKREWFKFPAAVVLCALFELVLSSCGGGAPAAEVVSPAEVAARPAPSDGMAIEGLHGTISEAAVEQGFERLMPTFNRCYADVVEDLEEIGGTVLFEAELETDGSVLRAHIRQSDLGALEVEECMLAALRSARFTPPDGGRAEFGKSITLDPPYGTKADSLDEKVVSTAKAKHDADVERCLGGSAGALVTLYVGMGGRVLASGASSEKSEMRESAACLARAARGWSFPDPGSRVQKASLAF